MAEINRRELVVGLAAMGAGGEARGQNGAVAGGGSLGAAKVLSPEGKVVKMPDGSDRWQILAGTFATGEAVTLHESWVPAGTPALPLHKIAHTQLIIVVEGTLEFLHDGVTDRAEAGSVIYVAYGTNDLVKNVGAGVARYFVMHVGGDTKKA